MTGAEIYIRFFPQNHLFTERYLRNAPPCLSFVLPKERQRRARWKKERAPNAGNIVQCVRSYARLSNLVQVWYKVHAGSPRRPQRCLGHRPRAAYKSGAKSRTEVPLSVSGMRGSKPRLTALAATLVAPLGSPPLRGVQRTLPLVAFLWRSGASRCRWQMQAQRLIRSRASGEPSRSRPAGGIAARRKKRSFPNGKECVLTCAGQFL